MLYRTTLTPDAFSFLQANGLAEWRKLVETQTAQALQTNPRVSALGFVVKKTGARVRATLHPTGNRAIFYVGLGWEDQSPR